MTWLTLDTSQGITSLALSAEGIVIATFTDATPSQQAAQLIPQIQHFMREHAMRFDDLDGVACITGVGGFTSVRIGVATARGIGLAAGIPTYGVALMELMAWYARRTHSVTSVRTLLPAGHRDVAEQVFAYSQVSGKMESVRDMQLILKEALPQDALPLCSISLNITEHANAILYPLEDTAALLAEWLHACQNKKHYLSPLPIYSRPPDAIAGAPLLHS
jgi:tRNA threonylcarbamoyl adenosine modification protein YeaZ